MKTNDKGLVYLNENTMNAIFDCVYGIDGFSKSETKELLKNTMFHDFVKQLLVQQKFNYRYRQEEISKLFPCLKRQSDQWRKILKERHFG